MTCTSSRTRDLELEARQAKAASELAELILAGRVTVTRDLKGRPSIMGWGMLAQSARDGFTLDSCALSYLASHGSWMIRNKLQQAGVTQQSLAKAGFSHH